MGGRGGSDEALTEMGAADADNKASWMVARNTSVAIGAILIVCALLAESWVGTDFRKSRERGDAVSYMSISKRVDSSRFLM